MPLEFLRDRVSVALVGGLNWIRDANAGKLDDRRVCASWLPSEGYDAGVVDDVYGGTHDLEGEAMRLDLAASLQCFRTPVTIGWGGHLWRELVGGSPGDVEDRLRRFVQVWREVAAGRSGDLAPSTKNMVWPFCGHEARCPNRYVCLFSFCDFLKVLCIPYCYPGTEVENLCLDAIIQEAHALVLDIATGSVIQRKGWPHSLNRDARAEPVVTAGMLAYLAGYHSRHENDKRVISCMAASGEGACCQTLAEEGPSGDGLFSDGLWLSVRFRETGRDSDAEPDRSLSATLAVATDLVNAADWCAQLGAQHTTGIQRSVAYACRRAKEGRCWTFTYGREHYLRRLPVSDVAGAILLADFLMRVAESSFCTKMISDELKQELVPLAAEMVGRIVECQSPDGFWPVVSRGAPIEGDLAQHQAYADQVRTLVSTPGLRRNVSFANTLNAVRTLNRFLWVTGARRCAHCGRVVHGGSLHYCGFCGKKLD